MTFEKQISLLSVILVLVCCKPANRDDGSPVIPGPVEDPFALVEGGESVSSIEAVNCRAVARVIGVKDGLGNLSSVSASCGAGWEQLKYEFTAVSSIAEVCLGTVEIRATKFLQMILY